MFKDVEEKIRLHKERIIRELIKKGVAPTEEAVKARLDVLDTHLALFHASAEKEGALFDVEAFNRNLRLIYQDLEIMYRLLYALTVKEFSLLKAYADTHLEELEDKARAASLLAEMESGSTTLGKTILFKHSGLNKRTENDRIYVDLGKIRVSQGSRIACIANINNIEPTKVLFGMKHKDEELYSATYNYNQDYITAGGELRVKTHKIELPEDQVMSFPLALRMETAPSLDSLYTVLAGRNKVMVKGEGTASDTLENRPAKFDTMHLPKGGYVSFYVVNGSKITFRFNKSPRSTNFSLDDYTVDNLKRIQHISIDCPEDFAFGFELDKGKVYAVKEKGIISGERILFSRSIEVRDFTVEEYQAGEKVEYEAFLQITQDDGAPAEIRDIAIKELSLLGGVEV